MPECDAVAGSAFSLGFCTLVACRLPFVTFQLPSTAGQAVGFQSVSKGNDMAVFRAYQPVLDLFIV